MNRLKAKKKTPEIVARRIAIFAAKEETKNKLLSAAISANLPEAQLLPSFGDTSSSDSDMLEPDSTKIADGEKADKEK